MPIVNGHQAECGCYVEGHWGQYGPDHLADQAEGFGWEPEYEEDDPRYWRRFVDEMEESPLADGPDREAEAWERHIEAADDIETWLNDHTPDECKSCGRPCKYNELYGGTLHDDGTEECGEPYGDNVCDPQSYVWHWHDGEFFLSPICDNEEECTDDTCAHWS